MKYLKRYRELSEGLKDKMIGKSFDDVKELLKGLSLENLLIKSAEHGYLEGVKRAINRGVFINYNDNLALKFAARNGHYDIVKLLLDVGADSNDINEPLILASHGGYVDVIKLLLDAGADPDVSDGLSLRYAVRNNDYDTVKLLLDSGANPHVNNNQALLIASEKGYNEIIELLQKYMKNNEGLKDKMTGLSISDAHHMIKKYGVKDKLTYIIHNDMVELFDQTVKEATDSDEDYLINEELLQMAINENSFDVFKKMVNDYPETIPGRERELIDYIFDDIIFFEHYNFLEELLKSDKVKEVLSEYNFKKYTNLLNNRINEGLKDKMIGKGEDDIIKRAEHITTEDKIFNGIKYDIFELVEMGVSEIKNDKKLLSEKGHLLLRFAVISGNMEAAKLLLDLDLDVNYQKEVLLRSAAFKENKDMIDLLISYGADLDRAISVEPYEKSIGADISNVPISYLNSVKFLKDYKEKYLDKE